MRLQRTTALITGGASGFGAGIVRKFVAEGAQVMIADLNTALAEELRQEMGAHAIVATANVADGASVEAIPAPKPDAPPVIIAVLPCKRMGQLLFLSKIQP